MVLCISWYEKWTPKMRNQWLYVWIWIRKPCLFIEKNFLFLSLSLHCIRIFFGTWKLIKLFIKEIFISSYSFPSSKIAWFVLDNIQVWTIIFSRYYDSMCAFICCCHHNASWLWIFDCLQQIVEKKCFVVWHSNK